MIQDLLFNVAKSTQEVHEAAPDSMLAFYINGYVYVRRICEEFHISEREVTSRWMPYDKNTGFALSDS